MGLVSVTAAACVPRPEVMGETSHCELVENYCMWETEQPPVPVGSDGTYHPATCLQRGDGAVTVQ